MADFIVPMSTIFEWKRGQPQHPKPPVSEEEVDKWGLSEENRALALSLVRYVNGAHDEFIDKALKMENANADLSGQVYGLERQVRTLTHQLTAAEEKLATSDAELVRLKNRIGSGQCENCQGAHFTQDCDQPAVSAVRGRRRLVTDD